MRTFPAVDITGADPDLVAAVVDDYSPSALEAAAANSTTAFFTTPRDRDAALHALRRAFPDASIAARDVADDDWARRSQENLQPVTVGDFVITPPWCVHVRSAARGAPLSKEIVINPSMGFGTGHHATTRLCLEALQAIDVRGRFVLDVGTGSGILALAARMLGAQGVVGIDYDADAIQCAEENLTENPGVDGVRFIVGDLRQLALPMADVVTANLTGTLLVQSADVLLTAVRPGGILILSGLLSDERAGVLDAFSRATLVGDREQDGWLGLMLETAR